MTLAKPDWSPPPSANPLTNLFQTPLVLPVAQAVLWRLGAMVGGWMVGHAMVWGSSSWFPLRPSLGLGWHLWCALSFIRAPSSWERNKT